MSAFWEWTLLGLSLCWVSGSLVQIGFYATGVSFAIMGGLLIGKASQAIDEPSRKSEIHEKSSGQTSQD